MIQKLFSRGRWCVAVLILLLVAIALSGCVGTGSTQQEKQSGNNYVTVAVEHAETTQEVDEQTKSQKQSAKQGRIDRNGVYSSKEDVAAYIHQYGTLPKNFITKKEAKALGWDGGSLKKYAPGKCIGGDYFGNYEKKLPKAKGRTYHECDIDTLGARSRGAKRIIYSSDGLIYYTSDHYETFTQLY